MGLKEYIQNLIMIMNDEEGEALIKTIFISLVASIITLGSFYFLKLRYIENFGSRYGFYLLGAMIGYALIISLTRQVKSYTEFQCMSGMMIGMTIGMIAGFLPGFYIGATNGMFWGSVSGMTIGIGFGLWNGRCCGIMGAMEGIMAGFMGGLMGAMTAIMMLNDNLKTAAIIVTIISGAIIMGLHYLIYKETREAERINNNSELGTIILSVLLMAATILLMIFGPRSVLMQ
ncbi:MAG TPA: hypothetical protein VJC39_04160 [Candidatus Nanoarchaeia archaeon]|nr:hypothetical protein [Candidatus Nanoarchaeia archaeon]